MSADLALQVTQAWEAVLGHRIDPETEFFGAGGDSLMAMRVISRLSAEHETKMPLRLLFDNPRCGDFISALDELLSTGQTAQTAP